MRDIHNNTKFTGAINPAAAPTANGTRTGVTIDHQGFESTEYVVQTGVITDGTFTYTLFHGDASNMSDEVAVPAEDLIGSNPVLLSTEDSLTEKVGYKGIKRYSRMKEVQSGATTGGFATVLCVQSRPKNAPVA